MVSVGSGVREESGGDGSGGLGIGEEAVAETGGFALGFSNLFKAIFVR